MAEDKLDLGPIVSSGHLASGALPALSEFEFGMIMTVHAFNRWMVRCMAAAGVPDLSPLDVWCCTTSTIAARPSGSPMSASSSTSRTPTWSAIR